MKDRPRFRFTLRDLFALVTIAALAIGLFLMALQSMKGPHLPARRAQCMNNQMQVGKAILTHAIAGHGEFVGYRHDLNGTTVSWPVKILPNIGRSDLYDAYLTSPPPPNTHRIDIYVCPSDEPMAATKSQLSYVINAGRADDAEEKLANGIARDYTVFSERMSIGYIAQHDGTANTLLLSENLQATTWDAIGKPDTTFLWHATTSPKAEHLINGGKKNAPLASDTARPSSNHNGDVVMTFCDGHTRFINEQIEYRVYMQLMTPSDADSDIPAPWRNLPLVESDLRWRDG